MINKDSMKVDECVQAMHKADAANNVVHNVHSPGNDAILSVVQHLNKPACQLEKFDGNPLHYHSFMRQFRAK